jgi:conjugal transfer pilus assembly protein TraD
MGEGLLMIDLKADYKVKEDFKSVCSMKSRENDLIIIDLSNPDKSYGYNPLLFGNASEIKDKIIGSFEWSEVHYKKISERVLQTVLSGLVWIRDKKNIVPTLEDLYFSISSVNGLNLLAEKIEDERIKQNIYSQASEYNKDFLKSLEGLKTDLALLVQSEFGGIFTKNTSLNVYKAIQERKVVLVNLDGQTYGESAKRFGRLILADLRSASGSIVSSIPESERPRFTVIVDEFADIISTEDMARTFVGFLNRCRGSGIGVVIAHQSLGDFKDQTVKSQIIDSTETLFSFVQKDPETCEMLAAIVGTKQVYEQTMQTEGSIFGDSETGRGTRKIVHEYIYHPNIFRSLGVGQAVYVAKKPTRFGIIQANLINLDHQNNHVFDDIVYKDENYRMLNLQKESLTRKESYKKAVKGDSGDDGPVDI